MCPILNRSVNSMNAKAGPFANDLSRGRNQVLRVVGPRGQPEEGIQPTQLAPGREAELRKQEIDREPWAMPAGSELGGVWASCCSQVVGPVHGYCQGDPRLTHGSLGLHQG